MRLPEPGSPSGVVALVALTLAGVAMLGYGWTRAMQEQETASSVSASVVINDEYAHARVLDSSLANAKPGTIIVLVQGETLKRLGTRALVVTSGPYASAVVNLLEDPGGK